MTSTDGLRFPGGILMYNVAVNINIKLIAALAVITAIFGAYGYIDANVVTLPSSREIVRFGLKPFSLIFFALTPIAAWWSMRTIYVTVGKQYWGMSVISGLCVQIGYLSASYLAIRQVPTRGQAIALGLNLMAIVVAAIKT